MSPDLPPRRPRYQGRGPRWSEDPLTARARSVWTSGNFLPMVRAGACVSGIDIAPNLIAQARLEARSAGCVVAFEVGNAPFPPAAVTELFATNSGSTVATLRASDPDGASQLPLEPTRLFQQPTSPLTASRRWWRVVGNRLASGTLGWRSREA